MNKVNVEVELDLNDLSTESLIDEIECRGYTLKDSEETKKEEDEIYDLYRDYLELDSDKFQTKLKSFFEDRLGIVVA